MKRFAIQFKNNKKWEYLWSTGPYGVDHYIKTFASRKVADDEIIKFYKGMIVRVVGVNLYETSIR